MGVVVLFFVSLSWCFAAAAPPTPADRLRTEFTRLQAAATNSPADIDDLWRFARACFDLGELATNTTGRATLAEQGIAASRRVVELAPRRAEGHYYLALNQGQLARTRTLGALRLVSEMEKSLKTALRLDPSFDFAGADRCLGLLYRDAPGWPASIGSREKARHHLEAALKRAPDSPENRLNWIESLKAWREEGRMVRQVDQFRRDLPRLREQFAGEEWALAWLDWDKRWKMFER